MSKARLEAFSDGVFAIVITLLILDVKIPRVEYDQLSRALLEILPKIFTYVMSFLIVGLYWVTHHNIMTFLIKTDITALWINLILLLFIGFIPFPTSLMGEFPSRQLPVVIYGVTLLCTNMIGLLLWIYACKHHRLINPNVQSFTISSVTRIFIIANLIFLFAIGISFLSVWISYFLYISAAIYVVLSKPRSV